MRFNPLPFLEPIPFECLNCLDCCRERWIYLTLGDIEGLMGLGKDPSQFMVVSMEDKPRFVLSVREWDLGCIFQDPETGLCIVHSRNPLICRIYPFMVSRKPLGVEGERPFEYEGEKLWLYYDKNCPGIGAEEPETIIAPEEIAKFGLEFEKELEETTLESVAELFGGN